MENGVQGMSEFGHRQGRQIWLRVMLAMVVGLVWWLAHKPAHALRGGDQNERTIEIHASKFKFDPAEITLKKGETVKLVLISDDVPHALSVSGLPIHADMVKDHPSTVVVTPSEVGDFHGKCSKFCGPGHRDMHFMVHVVP